MVITLSELQAKEIVDVNDGKRLGHINDIEVDVTLGKILSLVIYMKENGGLFGKQEEIIIQWNQIMTIGSDVILVNHLKREEHHSEEF